MLPFIFASLQQKRRGLCNLSRVLHMFGANVRHLGALHEMAEKAGDTALAAGLLEEITVRSLKNLFRETLDEGQVLDPERLRLRAREDFGFSKPLSPVTPELLARARSSKVKVRRLFTFCLFVAYALVDANKAGTSVATAEEAVRWYRQALQQYPSILLMQNLGVALTEQVRHLVGNQHAATKEIEALLVEADEVLSSAVELMVLNQTTGPSFCETMMNWAAVARFQGDAVALEKRCAAATASPDCPLVIRGNGAFFRARRAHEDGDRDALLQQQGVLMNLVRDHPVDVSSAAIYDAGVVSWWLNDTTNADYYFQLATQRPDTKAGALYMLATMRLQAGRLTDAMQSCESLLECDATFLKAHVLWAKAAQRYRPDTAEARLELLKQIVGRLNSMGNAGSSFGGDVPLLLGQAFQEIYHLSRVPQMAHMALHHLRAAVAESQPSDAYVRVLRGYAALDVAIATAAFICDECGAAILTRRHHCDTCGDYDLCSPCALNDAHPHKDQMTVFPFDQMDLVAECEASVLEACQIIDPSVSGDLASATRSAIRSVQSQAAATLEKIQGFTH